MDVMKDRRFDVVKVSYCWKSATSRKDWKINILTAYTEVIDINLYGEAVGGFLQ